MRTTFSAVTTACVVAAFGCGEPTGLGPGPDTRPIKVTFCTDYGPTWLAHQDEGGMWTRVPLINGVASFEGTEKQAIAVAQSEPGFSSVSVIYTTATTLEKLGCEDSDFSFGPSVVKGTVANLGEGYAFLNIGAASGFAGYDTDSAFSVYGVNNGAQDLFAIRKPSFDAVPDKMIVRRAQTYVHNQSVELDFGAAEAFALEQHALSITGAGSAMSFVTHEFQSGPASIALQYGVDLASVVALPLDKVVSGDFYRLNASVQDNAGFRAVMVTYKDAGDRTLAFGPAISQPTFSNVSTNPLRVRGELAAPAEYALGAAIMWTQEGQNSSRSFEVVVLKDYMGAIPAKWSIEMPDLRGTDGFQAGWLLSNASYDWNAQLIDGPIELLAGVAPGGDSMIRMAMTGSSGSLFGAPSPGSQPSATVNPLRRLIAMRR
jgi:hypothetical protein